MILGRVKSQPLFFRQRMTGFRFKEVKLACTFALRDVKIGSVLAAASSSENIMVTQRLYYTDSYTTTFDAELIEQVTVNGAPAALLDRTFFYPTSGGQPHDTGWMNDVPVADVIIRETDGAILHLLDRAVSPGRVTGTINWERRFDHMQHHTGQHILSQAFIAVAGAETVGFHLGPDSVTIDLDDPAITTAVADRAENLANQIVTANRPVRAWFPTDAELQTLTLRKVPDVDGKFRVVAIQDFDTNACGGTHVAFTGEIGLIKVQRVEKRGDITRIEFRCGGRALSDYREKHALLMQLAADLTTGFRDIPAVVEKLREENKSLNRTVRALQTQALAYEAEQLWQTAQHDAGVTIVVHAFEDRDVADIRQIVQHLIAHPATIVLCGAAGDKAHLIAARSDDLDHDMVVALKCGLAVLNAERGGGRPSFAQGGGVPATLADMQAALRVAGENVRSTKK